MFLINCNLAKLSRANHSSKYILSLLVLLVAAPAFAQKNKKIVPQFGFTQIDSLINENVFNIKRLKPSWLVVNTDWYVGSVNEGDKRFWGHRNHFNTYFLYVVNQNYYSQKLDNYGYFKRMNVKASQLEIFLLKNFGQMKEEKLTPKVDTVLSNGEKIAVTTIVDHQLIKTVKIILEADTLDYKYPADYSANKSNFQLNRYKFLHYIDSASKYYNNRNPQRIDVKRALQPEREDW